MKKITYLFYSILMIVLLFLMLHFAVKTSDAATGTSIKGGIESNTEQIGPSWYNESWHYRRPVTISSDASLSNYQVLVKLDNNNFDFNKASDKGWDVRFTKGDGTTLIDYWIESWNKVNQLAYIWVEVPSLDIGVNTIYLYYNNLGASDNSNGTATFDLFDDKWCQFPGSGCSITDPLWNVLDGAPTVSNENLVLINNSGISTIFYQYKYMAVGFKANFGLGDGLEWGGFINGAGGPRTMIRDLPPPSFDAHNIYLQDYVNSYDNNLLDGTSWHNAPHVYEVRWREGQSVGSIDHGTSTITSTLSTQVPTTGLPVTFYSFSGANATLLVDWVYVRKYHYPEPTVLIGKEQGAVDLEVNQVDSPDPLYAGEEVTYLVTVSNTSSITAMGVILTDTLPGGFSLVSTAPSQGSCISAVCNLGTVAAHNDAIITVRAKTTIDGVFTNTAVVNSFSYDLNNSNNISQEPTTVLSSADMAIELRGVPQAVRPNDAQTYIITVTNQGPSLAGMVNEVNILPAGVEYQSSLPNICSAVGYTVTCPFINPMIAHTSTQIRIIGTVISTTTQKLDSSATVSSTTHDPLLTNNTSQVETLLDATKPVVNWISPVNDEVTYITYGGPITLEASAVDYVYGNDQIDRVQFRLWDHLQKPNPGWVIIGTFTSSPYQVEFNSDRLVQGEIYQMYVYATDRAGNESRQRILIVRQSRIFLPLTRK
jgi:uncharacterized repeat protein (TIGR01451 family)